MTIYLHPTLCADYRQALALAASVGMQVVLYGNVAALEPLPASAVPAAAPVADQCAAVTLAGGAA